MSGRPGASTYLSSVGEHGESTLECGSLVVAFGCQLDDAPPGLAIQRWDDVPAVSLDFGRARDAIAARVRALVDQIASA